MLSNSGNNFDFGDWENPAAFNSDFGQPQENMFAQPENLFNFNQEMSADEVNSDKPEEQKELHVSHMEDKQFETSIQMFAVESGVI